MKAEVERSGYFEDFLAVKTDVEISDVGKVNYLYRYVTGKSIYSFLCLPLLENL